MPMFNVLNDLLDGSFSKCRCEPDGASSSSSGSSSTSSSGSSSSTSSSSSRASQLTKLAL
eukprot:4237974-Heterocapsa_arctica.AAC.1